jgi:FlaA1/EpsC-like NDP-sugar epimerase
LNPLITTPTHVNNPLPSVKGRAFIVTGAAGSIGSEVCRRLCREGARVTGVDIDENGLTYLADDCGPSFVPVVADVSRWGPTGHGYVGAGAWIHCAARKHVALGETHRAEYHRTNVTGTLRAIQAAEESHSAFVLVSTDKAVEPTCHMGTTKRSAELLALSHGQTVVRLVNVYGSRGSVVPRWRRQVEQGQPCTITDWNHRRFYMTVEHAAWTIIDAAVRSLPGKIVVPKGYVELTTRQLLESEDWGETVFDRPSGEKVSVIGPRPGERDHETLMYDYEKDMGEYVDPGLSPAGLKECREVAGV